MRDSTARAVLVTCGAVALLGVIAAAARRARAPFAPRQVQPGLPLAPAPRLPWRPLRFGRRAPPERVETLSRRKQDFLGLLSHELRNPLSAINVALAVMRSREDAQAGQRARTVIERQVQHIGRLVEDLVDTARIERGTLSLHLETVDVREVLVTAVEMASPSMAQRQQELVWQPPRDAMFVYADRVRLQQVFSNLLLNASKYSPEEGRITLGIVRDGSDFRVEVRDNGQGIAVEDLGRVFEPFVRAARDEPGLGIGLYVARTLVEQHGGEISVRSEGPRAGATFAVRLPELSPLLRQVAPA
jgi:signal transduction histidine kinase